MQDGELWWGGTSDDGTKMPFDKDTEYSIDFREVAPNQTMPLFLSGNGRYIWSENPFKLTFSGGKILIEGEDVKLYEAGECLRDAYLAAMKRHFPFSGKKLPHEFFKTAQYNTWIEFRYNPTQEGVLKYAHDLIENGFEPGIFIIDEGWHGKYGLWEFDFLRFPDPKAMVDELHGLGYKVMLWVVPWVCADGKEFIVSYHENPELYMRTEGGEPALMRWWNGFSAILDCTKKCDCEFLEEKLVHLMNDYGVDGFKFDGGVVASYSPHDVVNGKPVGGTAHEKNMAWNRFGEGYKYHEYKDTFKGGGKAVIQRLRDKHHGWDNDGLDTLVPNGLAAGIIGHPFICPDMIGGGEWAEFEAPGFVLDEELFVRMAQCSALFPMMQFSLAPYKVLSPENLKTVVDAANLHREMADEIIALAEKAAEDGEPIMRYMEYHYPHKGYGKITDQFMLGENILVAPVLTKGAREREVILPDGKWTACDGKVYEGGQAVTVDAPLERLLWFRKNI